MDSKELNKKDLFQEKAVQPKEITGFTEFSAEEIKSSYAMAGIHENQFREFDASTGMMKDATRSKNMSEEEFKLGKARTMAMHNMKMAHRSMIDLKQDVINAGRMSGEMRNILMGIDTISEYLSQTIDCRTESKGKISFNMGEYRKYVGEIMGAYDYTIEKAMYYLENKTPRTDRGKNRYQFVQKFASYLKREREAFSANAQIKEREMNAERAAHVSGGNILFDIRAELIDDFINEGKGLTKSAQTYTRNNKKYYFKEEKEVELEENSYMESVHSYLIHFAQIPDHVKTDIDNLKERIASLVIELQDMFKNDIQFFYVLLEDFANSKIDLEDFIESINNRIVSWGVSEEKATEVSDEIKNELQKDHAETEKYRGALQQVLNFNQSNSLASYNGIETGRTLGFRNVASRRTAELFGCKECIADTKTVLFTDEKGALKSGTSMEEVNGRNLMYLIKKYRKVEFTGKAKRMICDLQFMDFICGQMDRHIGNYIVDGRIKDGVVIVDSVVGIDNDMSFGVKTYSDLKHGFNRLAGPESGGEFAMQKISKDLYVKILKMKPEVLKYSLADLSLSEKEFNALTSRLKGIQRYLRSAYKKFGDAFLVEKDNDWAKLSSEDIYDGNKTFLKADGTEQYQSIWGGIEVNLEALNGECNTL